MFRTKCSLNCIFKARDSMTKALQKLDHSVFKVKEKNKAGTHESLYDRSWQCSNMDLDQLPWFAILRGDNWMLLAHRP